MFAKFLSRRFAGSTARARVVHTASFTALQSQYLEWKRQQDITAIARSFCRLSDRQLAMIGVQDRSDVHFLIMDLMAQAQERIEIAENVAGILEEKPQTAGEPDMAQPSQGDRGKPVSVAA